ncbi:MAG: hypothetical protein EPO52_12375 [Herbiconiux sp.]|uniref:hypothetical protein n=1 Tax=Herbiconiux sp. TaxID=1871186 RepID=UPI00120BC101|nr:hypothetical protein [Herbiconiux sp.]TAJ47291.1 MAG: hypothetical protein EPO52_12375 [Herbiconiux sp.]
MTNRSGCATVDTPRPIAPRLSHGALVVITVFNALSALAGGIAILAGLLPLPPSMLEGSPFDSFFWPGVILLFVIGGSQTVSALLLLWRWKSSLLWSAVAGFGLIIWIFVETGIIGGSSWLQILYFATGVAQLTLVLALLGVVTRRPPSAPALTPPELPPVFGNSVDEIRIRSEHG